MENYIDFQIFIKTAAVSGIAFLWSNFTVVALKTVWHIVSYSPENRKPVVKEEACRDDNPN